LTVPFDGLTVKKKRCGGRRRSYVKLKVIRGAKEMAMKYKVALEESEEGFAVSAIGLPGCHSQGATEQEAMENITDAIREYLGVAEELANGATIREVEVEV
jgi:predicted RNase H-like HicB family nuclease